MIVSLIKRWRWALLIALLLAAGLLFAFWPERVPVDTGEVSRGPMTVGITDDGVTRAEEYYVVSAPVTGYLARIELEAGDEVSRGALITRMTGVPSTPLDQRSERELRAALTSARASEGGARASLEQAERDLVRAEELAERGFLPRAQLEAARTRVANGRAVLDQTRGEVRRIEALLTQPGGAGSGTPVPVRAPASGSVMSVITESEGVIAQGTQLMTIGDPQQIEAVVDLISREAARVSVGDLVMITQWGGEGTITGRVTQVEPFGRLKISALGIEEQRVNVIVGFDAEQAEALARLGHGYQIDATFVLWSAEDALRVPIGALFRGSEGDWRVFAIDGGRAVERAVVLGHLNDEHAEVLEGLDEGETVILNPGGALEDGVRVEPRE
ncbi:efflux RND transporter periplasmic adaptor subunit [Aurantiacibacter sp. MUD11]|uniref:efflux RND transporter periplasmic adaptor subunit n=1 Tax=Aurantiacibacter sp. MUD11 TaxID=3003265 RepID=UPI0022AA4F72|nr:efflux RND transporter periplasmic adaptor subunit [Aurantiacibacter sp. MUD11]WAT18606.1 efflux RND transporter periplasmic adaptor subunit [Aurantiacibacter sp. MUD11]